MDAKLKVLLLLLQVVLANCESLELAALNEIRDNKGYKEPCDKNFIYSCNSWAGLVCDGGKCNCESDAVWNAETQLCYSDTACSQRYKDSYFDAEQGSCVIQIKRSCFNDTKAPCPRNSYCTTHWKYKVNPEESHCLCQSLYRESEDYKKCVPKRSHGDKCNPNEYDPCHKRYGLICLKGSSTCGCNGDLIWDADDGGCNHRHLVKNSPQDTKSLPTPNSNYFDCTDEISKSENFAWRWFCWIWESI